MRANAAIMIDRGRTVDDGVLANDGARLQHRAGHQPCAAADLGSILDHGGWVNKRRKGKCPADHGFEHASVQAGPRIGVSTPWNQYCVFRARFVDCAGKSLDFDIAWDGEGIEEKGFDRKTRKPAVTVSETLLRPAEVDLLIGDFARARTNLAWKPKTNFPSLASMMTGADYDRVKSDRVFF